MSLSGTPPAKLFSAIAEGQTQRENKPSTWRHASWRREQPVKVHGNPPQALCETLNCHLITLIYAMSRHRIMLTLIKISLASGLGDA